MDARRYLARELKKKGFRFLQLKEGSPCFREFGPADGVRYSGWFAQLDCDYKGAPTTQLVYVVDQYVPSLENPGARFMLRVISSDVRVGSSTLPHRCYQVCDELGSDFFYCPRNYARQVLQDIKAGSGYASPQRLEQLTSLRPTKDLVKVILDSVDASINACENPPL